MYFRGVIILILMMFVVGTAQAQNAIDKSLNLKRSGKLALAAMEIDNATIDPAYKNLATTWFYRGEIYMDVFRNKESNTASLDTAYHSMIKALTLDPDQEFLQNIILKLKVISSDYYRIGAQFFNSGRYNVALALFEKSIEINKTPLIAFSDTSLIMYTAKAAELCKNNTSAKKYYQKLVNMKIKDITIYLSLGDIYMSESNMEKAVEIYEAGIKYDNFNSIEAALRLINYSLKYGKTEEALKYIEMGKDVDPINAQVYFYEAGLYHQQLQEKKAIEAYKEGLKYEPADFTANSNLGILLYNSAISHKQEADKYELSDQEKYKSIRSKYYADIMDAVNYLEIAYAEKRNDKSLNTCLLDVYERLNRTEQAERLKDKMKAMGML